MLLDVDQLNDEQKQMLMAYLQQEYEKNPDDFQLPKEKLQEILAQGGRIVSADEDGEYENQEYENQDEEEDGLHEGRHIVNE